MVSDTNNPVPPFAVVEDVTPQVDAGRFPIKRIVGDSVEVNAACFAHGHELVACVVRFREQGGEWVETPMESLGNDLWRASFDVDAIGRWEYTVHCWVDHLTHWRDEFIRRVDPDDIRLAAKIGATLIARCGADRRLNAWAETLLTERDL